MSAGLTMYVCVCARAHKKEHVTPIADSSHGKICYDSNSSGCEHVMTQWPDSIYSFPDSFCHDSLPTQLHALSYVFLVCVIIIFFTPPAS